MYLNKFHHCRCARCAGLDVRKYVIIRGGDDMSQAYYISTAILVNRQPFIFLQLSEIFDFLIAFEEYSGKVWTL